MNILVLDIETKHYNYKVQKTEFDKEDNFKSYDEINCWDNTLLSFSFGSLNNNNLYTYNINNDEILKEGLINFVDNIKNLNINYIISIDTLSEIKIITYYLKKFNLFLQDYQDNEYIFLKNINKLRIYHLWVDRKFPGGRRYYKLRTLYNKLKFNDKETENIVLKFKICNKLFYLNDMNYNLYSKGDKIIMNNEKIIDDKESVSYYSRELQKFNLKNYILDIVKTKKYIKIYPEISYNNIDSRVFGTFIDYSLRYFISKFKNLIFYDDNANSTKNKIYKESYNKIKENKEEFPKDIFICSLSSNDNDNIDIESYINIINIEEIINSLKLFCEYISKSEYVVLSPNLWNSSGSIKGVGDLIIDDFLIDIKCYKDKSSLLGEKNINQLIIYKILALQKYYNIKRIGFYDFYRGEIIYWNVDNENIIRLENEWKKIEHWKDIIYEKEEDELIELDQQEKEQKLQLNQQEKEKELQLSQQKYIERKLLQKQKEEKKKELELNQQKEEKLQLIRQEKEKCEENLSQKEKEQKEKDNNVLSQQLISS